MAIWFLFLNGHESLQLYLVTVATIVPQLTDKLFKKPKFAFVCAPTCLFWQSVTLSVIESKSFSSHGCRNKSHVTMNQDVQSKSLTASFTVWLSKMIHLFHYLIVTDWTLNLKVFLSKLRIFVSDFCLSVKLSFLHQWLWASDLYLFHLWQERTSDILSHTHTHTRTHTHRCCDLV